MGKFRQMPGNTVHMWVLKIYSFRKKSMLNISQISIPTCTISESV